MGKNKICHLKMTFSKKVLLCVLTFVLSISLLGIVIDATAQSSLAEGETIISSISVTVNEQTGRATVMATGQSVSFRVNKNSANSGVGYFSISFMSNGYLFDSNLSVTVNGKAHTDFEMAPNYSAILLTYTASTNYIDLYEGESTISSDIDFGTVEKTNLPSTYKTLKIKNVGSAPTMQLSITAVPVSSNSGGSEAGGGSAAGGGGMTAFTIASSPMNSIAAGGEATFILGAVSSLPAGTYNATLNIKSTAMNSFNGYPIDKSYNVSMTVDESYKLTMYENDSKVADGTVYDFGSMDIDDLGTISKTFTFKNEGKLAITALEFELTQSKSIFSIDKSAVASIATNGTFTLTLTADTQNAEAGSYQYIPLQWKNGDESVTGYVVLKITITEKDPYVLEAYNESTKLSPTSTYNFGTIELGENPPSPKTFKLINAGNNVTGILNVLIECTSYSSGEAYTVVSTIPNIAKGGYYDLSIQPKSNLPAGNYSATINIYNDNLAIAFKLNYTVHTVTEITYVEVQAKDIVAPTTDATISPKTVSSTYYSVNIVYQEKSGNDWIGVTSATFLGGKIYRIKFNASIKNTNNYRFSTNATMALGSESAESVTLNESKTLLTGYKTYSALPASEYSLEMVCSSENYSENVYTFSNMEDEYVWGQPALFTFNNLGTQPTGDLNVSSVLYNTSTAGVYYEYDPVISSIPSGESFIFEIKPVLELEPNPLDYYWETVTISNNKFSFTFDVKMRVVKKAYKVQVEYEHVEINPATSDAEDVEYKLRGGDTANYSFDHLVNTLYRPYENLKVGYSATDANRFEQQFDIVNKGNNALTNISVTHSGAGDAYFNFTTSSLSSSVQASNYQKKYTYFKVAPKVGAPAGTHKTTVVITADNLDPIIITFSFTVNTVIDEVVISGLTIPEGYDYASRNLTVETEGVYIRILGWSKVDNAIWLGKNQNIFNAGNKYKLNLHLNTKTGKTFKNYSSDNSWAGSKIAFNFTITFEGIDFEAEILAGNLISHSLSGETFSADSCYYTATFLAKEPSLKGSAKIETYDYETNYVLNASYGVEGLDQASNLSFMWYKDGVALNNNFDNINSYYTIPKSSITADSIYYYEIHHSSRIGTMRSESIVLGPNTRIRPSTTIVHTVSPATCTNKGTISWYRDGLEYRIASEYDDLTDVFEDWITATVNEVVSGGGGGTTSGGTGGTTSGGGGATVSYQGSLTNVNGGTIFWFRYKQTDLLPSSDIGVFVIEKGTHNLQHHDAVVPEPSELCECNSIEEYNYCTMCDKYFDMNGNKFDSIDYLTTYAVGHKDENGDLSCDICGASIMSKYFFKVNSLDDIVAGAKYIIVDDNGKVMEMVGKVSDNGGKYVNALSVNRIQADVDNDRYSSSDIDKINAFIFQINTMPSKSTAVKTCYSLYYGDTCIDFSDGLILSPKSWNERTGFSITTSATGVFTIATWNNNVSLAQATLKNDGSSVFALNAGNKLLSSSATVHLYRLVSETTTLDGYDCEIKEKKTESDYSAMGSSFDENGGKSTVIGVTDAIDEEYVKVFAKKKELTDEKAEGLKIEVKSSVEVLDSKDNEITMDVHPVISCGDKSETIPDRNLNGKEMTLTLYAGTSVPDTITHRLTTGGVEIIYKESTDPDKKSFTYEIDDDGNVYVTFTVTQFSTFVLTSTPSSPVVESVSGTVEISGTAKVGETLTAELKDSNIESKNAIYVWKRDGVAISGATSSTYTLTETDKGAKITVTVSDNIHTGTITSQETSEVAETGGTSGGKTQIIGTIELSGKAQVGQYLYFEVKDGNVDSTTQVYTWYRGTTIISGATNYNYLLTASDKGYKIHVTVSDGVHDGTLTSSETDEVTEASTPASITGSVSISGTAKVGETLTAEVKDSNLDISTAIYEWFRDDGPIVGATATTYTIQAGDKGYKIYVKVHDETHNGNLQSSETDEVTESNGSGGGKDTLTGTVNILGTAKVGERLTVEIKDSNVDLTTISYFWMCGVTTLDSGDSYTLTASDIGKKILVMISDGVHDGILTSSETAEVENDKQSTPSVEKTDCTNCLNNDGTITGVDNTMEYSVDGTEWLAISKTTVGGLTNGTYYVRYKAKDKDNPASESAIVVIGEGSHSFGEWQAEKPADCKNTGEVAHKECSVCHKNFDNDNNEIADIVIPLGDHSYGNWTTTKNPTCTEEGTKERVCGCCGNKESDTIAAIDHDYVFSKIEWTEYTAKALFVCSHDSYHTQEYTCNITNSVTKVATCVEQGIKTYTATYLTYSDTKNEILPIDESNHDIIHHNYLAPTCTQNGHNAYDECTRCSYTTKEEMEAINHDWNTATYTWSKDNSTCTAKRTCKHDATHIEQETVSVSKSVIQNLTCVLDEIANLEATFNNEAFATQTKNGIVAKQATGHKFGKWIVTKEASFTGAGSKHRVCSVCGEEETEEIVKLDALPYFTQAIEEIDMEKSLEDIYDNISSALEYYEYVDDKTAVGEEYDLLCDYIDEYTEIVQAVNVEFETAKEIEDDYFLTILQMVNYMSFATYALLKGKRWFL